MKIVTSVALEAEHIQKLTMLSKRTGLSRSDVMRRLIESAELITHSIEKIEVVVPPEKENGDLP